MRKVFEEMRQVFEEIYAKGYGSGVGSLPIHTRGYIRVLEQFLHDHRIKSVVDLGCGDWQFSRLISWDKVHYLGYDLVRSVIERNRAEFSTEGIEFHVFSGNFEDLPSADLLIAKDVLQHWSNKSIITFLPSLKRYQYSLITGYRHNIAKQNSAITSLSKEAAAYLSTRCPGAVLSLGRPPATLAAPHRWARCSPRRAPLSLRRNPRALSDVMADSYT